MATSEMKTSSKSHKHFEDYETLMISSKFMIQLEPSDSYEGLSDAKKRLIQTNWDKEQKRRDGKLHEGAILSAISYDNKGLKGQFVPYKYYLAQLYDPSLKADLKIIPVSISGMTLIGDGDQLLLAKRASWVAQYPEKYELAPSGGVRPPAKDLDAVDLKLQLLEELVEETGIESKEVKSVKFFTLVHDHTEDAVELCAEIHLKTSSLILSSSREYSQMMIIPCQELDSFTKNQKEEFVPLSLILLKLKKLIP